MKDANVLDKKIDTYFIMLIDIFKEHGLRIRLEYVAVLTTYDDIKSTTDNSIQHFPGIGANTQVQICQVPCGLRN